MDETSEVLQEVFRCYYLKFDYRLLHQIGESVSYDNLFRRLAWQIHLEILPLPVSPLWVNIIEAQRERYDQFLEYLKPTQYDDVIGQDINRLFSDIPFFMVESTRNTVKRMCQVFAQNHPNIGYQQGVHELVAIVYLAFSGNTPPFVDSPVPFPQEYLDTFKTLTKKGYTEHDAYIATERIIVMLA
ncbi:hypothetical protein EIN_487780, partial [Entamoeba invadens IP1]